MDTTALLPAMVSTVLILSAAFGYKEAMAPPNPQPNQTNSTRYNFSPYRVFSRRIAATVCLRLNYLVLIHFALEIYFLWTVGGRYANGGLSPDQSLGIPSYLCPSISPSAMKNIHPNQRIPLLSIIPLGLITLGAFVRVSCHYELGRFFVWDMAVLKDHQLVTSGFYRFVRHPAYSGYAGIVFGYALFLWVPGTFGRECIIGRGVDSPSTTGIPRINNMNAIGLGYALFYTAIHTDVAVFLIRRSFMEDGMLKREFGKEWEEWAARVRWNVFPYIL